MSQNSPNAPLDSAAGVAWLAGFVGDDRDARWNVLAPLAKIAAKAGDLAALDALVAAGASPWLAIDQALDDDNAPMWSSLAPRALVGAKGLDERLFAKALQACAAKKACSCFEAAAEFAQAQRAAQPAKSPLPACDAVDGLDGKQEDLDLDQGDGRLDMEAIRARWAAKELWSTIASFDSPEVSRMAKAAQSVGMGMESRWDSGRGRSDARAPDDSPLQTAIRSENAPLTQVLLEMGARIDRGALLTAVATDNVELCAALVARCGPDAAPEGWTFSPLESAIESARLGMARLLLSAGADPNAICEGPGNSQGQSMLQFLLDCPAQAGRSSRADICAALLAAGADPHFAPVGKSPLAQLGDSRAWGDQVEMREMMSDVLARRELVADLREASSEPAALAASSLRI